MGISRVKSTLIWDTVPLALLMTYILQALPKPFKALCKALQNPENPQKNPKNPFHGPLSNETGSRRALSPKPQKAHCREGSGELQVYFAGFTGIVEIYRDCWDLQG